MAEKEELIKHLRFDFLFKLVASAGQGRRSTTHQGRFPLVPGNAAVGMLQRLKQSIVFKPVGIALGEGFKSAAESRVGSTLVMLIRFAQQIILEAMNLLKFHAFC